jgi:hypothetical protein
VLLLLSQGKLFSSLLCFRTPWTLFFLQSESSNSTILKQPSLWQLTSKVLLSLSLSLSLSLCIALQLFGPWQPFRLLILYTIGRSPWTGDQPVTRPLPTHRTTQTQTSWPRVEFEPTILVFERAKTVHALDRAATLIYYLESSVPVIPQARYRYDPETVPSDSQRK